MHRAFVVRIELSSPIILNPRLALDGVLASTVFERTGDIGRAHKDLPLKSLQEIYLASELFAETPAPRSVVKLTRNMKPGLGLTAQMVQPKRGERIARVLTHRDSYKTLMDTYVAYSSKALWAFGQGEVSAVRDLLTSLGAIGKKRAQGFGQISRVEVEERSGDESFGLRSADGRPARSVPWKLWKEIGGSDAVTTDVVPVTMPRWSAPRVLCAVPSRPLASRSELEGMLG